MPGLLLRHDKCSENITVLDETLAVRLIQVSSHGCSRRCRCFGDGNNHIDVLDGLWPENVENLGRQAVSHALSATVDADSIHDGVWSSKVNVFEDVRRIGFLWCHLTEDGFATLLNDDRLTRLDITDVGEAQLLQSNRLGSHHVVHTLAVKGASGTNGQRTNSVRVTETHETKACQHSCAGPSTFTSLVHPTQTGKEVFPIHSGLLGLAQLVSEDVEHEFTVTVGVDVTVSLKIQMPLQLRGVDQVAIVGQTDTIGTVDVEWLGLSVGTATGRGVSQVTNSHESREVSHPSTVLEDAGRHSVGLELVNPSTGCAGCDTCSILTSIYAKTVMLTLRISYHHPQDPGSNSRCRRYNASWRSTAAADDGFAWIRAMIPHIVTGIEGYSKQGYGSCQHAALISTSCKQINHQSCNSKSVGISPQECLGSLTSIK